MCYLDMEENPRVDISIRRNRHDAANIPGQGLCGPLLGYSTSHFPFCLSGTDLDLDGNTRAHTSFLEYLRGILSLCEHDSDATSQSMCHKLRLVVDHLAVGGIASLSEASGSWLCQFEAHYLCSRKYPTCLWMSTENNCRLRLLIDVNGACRSAWSLLDLQRCFEPGISHVALSCKHFHCVTLLSMLWIFTQLDCNCSDSSKRI